MRARGGLAKTAIYFDAPTTHRLTAGRITLRMLAYAFRFMWHVRLTHIVAGALANSVRDCPSVWMPSRPRFRCSFVHSPP